VDGLVGVSLAAPAGGSASACTTVSRELAHAIIQHPEDYYVNVYTLLFPGGLVRGQLTK